MNETRFRDVMMKQKNLSPAKIGRGTKQDRGAHMVSPVRLVANLHIENADEIFL